MATSYRFDSTYHPYESIYETKKRFYTLSQRHDESVREWSERFTGMTEMLESYGINICEDNALLNHEAQLKNLKIDDVENWTDADKRTYEECKKVAQDRSLAMAFLKGACQYRFGALLKQMRNEYVQKIDRYPRDVVSAQNILTHYRKPVDAKFKKERPGGGGDRNKPKDEMVPDVAFAQQGEKMVPGTDGKLKPGVRCHGCNAIGHMKNECPKNAAPTAPAPDTKAADMNFFQHDLRGTSEDGHGVSFFQDDLPGTTADTDEDPDGPAPDVMLDPSGPVEFIGLPLPPDDRRADENNSSEDDISSSTGTLPPLESHSSSNGDTDADVDSVSTVNNASSGSRVSDSSLPSLRGSIAALGVDDIVLVAGDAPRNPPAPVLFSVSDAGHHDSSVARASAADRQLMGHAHYIHRALAHPHESVLRRAIRDGHIRIDGRVNARAVDDNVVRLPRIPPQLPPEALSMSRSDSFEDYLALSTGFQPPLFASAHPRPELASMSFAQMGLPWGPRVIPPGLRADENGDFVIYDSDYVDSDNTSTTAPSSVHSDAASVLSGTGSHGGSVASQPDTSHGPDLSDFGDFTFLEVSSGPRPRPGRINPLWILLDSESTVSVFGNKDLLVNIRPSSYTHHIYSNGGFLEVTMIGDLPHFGTVWYSPASLANILSLAAVRKICRVTMDSAASPSFQVYRSDGTMMRFVESRRGLYYFDATPSTGHNHSKLPVTDYSFVNTVAENMKQFSSREIEGAKAARHLYRCIGRPSHNRFLRILDNNELINCPVTSADAKRAEYIYGPDVAVLKGKTVRSPTSHVPSHTPVILPEHILKFHKDVTLCADIFKVQGIRFIHTIARKIQLRTVEELSSGATSQLLAGINTVKQVYEARGFKITSLHADNDFKPLEHDILPTKLNICAANEHVGEIERSIRTVKNTIRSTIQGLPFKRYTKQMVRSLVKLSVCQLNMFVATDGVSETMSPKTIVTGEPKPDFNVVNRASFGEYVQTHEEPDPSNSMEERSTGALALRPIGNAQGGYYFLSLTTWKVLRRRKWTPLPMPTAVLDAVHKKAEEEGQPLIKNGNLEFRWASTNQDIQDEVDEEEDKNETNESVSNESDEEDESHADLDENDLLEPRESLHENEQELNIQEVVEAIMEEEDVEEDDEIDEVEDDPEPSEEQRSEPSGDIQEHAETEGANTISNETSDQATHEVEGARYNFRSNRRRTYDHAYPEDDFTMLSADTTKIADVVFTQMSARKGIAKHGQVAIDAMIKEYAQLDELNVFKPLDSDSLTKEQKMNALGSVDLIKEKRCGKIKGRTCADGRPQRAYIPREDSTSPTISLEALLVTLVIDAHEKRDVATADISGAFLRGTNEDFDVMKIVGQMVDNVVAANPKQYEPYVCYENGKKVLYLQLVKAMYGLLKAAIIWWKLFSGQLEDMGFKINPYDRCVANKVINGKQCTIGWYVDDIKVSHSDPKVVDEILSEIEKHFDKMTITRGTKHVYVGMDIEFLPDGRVKILTKDYILECIEAFGEEIKRPANTPAKKNLFEVDETSKELSKEQAEIFHSITAKLLWVSRRSRLDIQTAIAFLCTRVQKPTEEDWIKLRRVLQYLMGTIDMPRILSARTMHIVNTYVDAAYAVHMDMKSHTGGCVSMGDGVIQAQSKKQSLNTKSSTEAEVVGASDFLPFTIWYKYFLEHQGHDIEKFNFFQDNQSAMRLEKNGIDSARQRSRHINIRYFFIKDRMNDLDIDISYCPSEVMVGDFFSKPLQGSLFRKFRDVIQGLTTIESLNESYMSSVKERVGKINDDEVDLGGKKTGEIETEKNDGMTNDRKKNGLKNDILKQKDTADVDVTKVKKRSYAEVVIGDVNSDPNK